ncbi:hypothetical protein PVV74_21075 [Roseovarius sp. SK2]|jgi:hypothetical protein|uniref:hypothetical protein n=1 Tax=Roseovarius TaxID=74030 RepID=UPI00237ACDA4|nr:MULTISPECIES: hypothetical protein [unclassified Roseovarius]MDD9727946.1 hypothetical protein [Roseovarius sp. SK2]
MQAHSDTGTVIPSDTFALTVAPDGTCEILMPDGSPDDDMPAAVAALTAVFIRMETDPNFIRDQIAWLDARPNA